MNTHAHASRFSSRALLPLLSLLLVTAGLLHTRAAQAEEPAASTDQAGQTGDMTRWGLGIGVSSDTRPYRDFDRKPEFMPLLAFENRWVRVAGPGVELKLLRHDAVALGMTLSYARDGYRPDDSPVLAGMARRSPSAWLGLRASLRSPVGQLTAEWSGDAASHSKGRKLKLGLDHRFAQGEFGLTPRVSATWLDAAFVQYYFGVEAGEARADRAAYTPGSAVNVDAGLRLDWRLDAQQTLFADLGVTRLGRSIRSSPLVDRSTVPGARLGWLYRF